MQAPANTKAISASPGDMGRSFCRGWTYKTIKAGGVNERFCK